MNKNTKQLNAFIKFIKQLESTEYVEGRRRIRCDRADCWRCATTWYFPRFTPTKYKMDLSYDR